ncbi:MAG TPA: PDZ domain-containing protein [Candidatus Binataceae bacterium]|nr:PDZ domain-containing protein [Candidatus Binataceae bacterium]
MRNVGISRSGPRWSVIALCAASFAICPALAGAQAGAVAAAPTMAVLPPGTTVPPAPGSDAPAVHVAGQEDAVAAPPENNVAAPPTTTEIPPVLPLQAQSNAPTPPTLNAPNTFDQSPDLSSYENQQTPAELQEQLQSLQQFLSQGDNTTTIGMVVREGHRKIDGGGEVSGLLIVNVMAGSPAAQAGLQGVRTATHVVLEGAAVAASLFFPPAIMAVALVDGSGVGESYDMIIAVDSVRVTNFLDFSDRMRQVQPGDIVYLSVLRNGRRMQFQVKVPGTIPQRLPLSGSTVSAAAARNGSTTPTASARIP